MPNLKLTLHLKLILFLILCTFGIKTYGQSIDERKRKLLDSMELSIRKVKFPDSNAMYIERIRIFTDRKPKNRIEYVHNSDFTVLIKNRLLFLEHYNFLNLMETHKKVVFDLTIVILTPNKEDHVPKLKVFDVFNGVGSMFYDPKIDNTSYHRIELPPLILYRIDRVHD